MAKKRGSSISAKQIALREIKKEKFAQKIETFFLILTLISASVLLILFSTQYLFTGYSTYIESYAGDITSIVIERDFPTTYWNGVYGLALRVPDFTEILSAELESEIDRQDLFFDCLDTSAEGGNEVYAATVEEIDFETLVPATPAEVDAWTGCASMKECVVNTFTETMWVMVGSSNITNIPATHTYRWDGQNDIFDIGILKDGNNNFVFVTHIQGIQRSYNQDFLVHYQMLLPSPPTNMTYYFFTDPNDECPPGSGFGTTLQANLYGYVTDILGNPIENATVILAGGNSTTDSNGFYNLTRTLPEGTYSVIAGANGYDDFIGEANFTFTNYTLEKNITLETQTPGAGVTYIPHIYGNVLDESKSPILGATVSIGNTTATTNLLGYFSLYPSLSAGNQTIIAYKEDYNNNYSIIDLSSQPPEVNVTILLEEIQTVEELLFATGPYTEEPVIIEQIIQEAQKNGEDFWVSTKELIKEVRRNTFVEDSIGIYNFGGSMSLSFSLSPSLDGVVDLSQSTLSIPSNSFGELKLVISGTKPIGVYEGNLTISGSLNQEIPVRITIVERRLPIETLLMAVDLFENKINPGKKLKYKLSLQNLMSDQSYLVDLKTIVRQINGTETYYESTRTEEISSSLTILDEILLPEEIPEGEYALDIEASYLNLYSTITSPFSVVRPIYMYSFLGIPLWIYMAIVSFLSFILLNFILYKRHMDKKRRYSVAVDYGTLPQPGERTINLGHVAETKKNAYLELERLTTHTIVSGATGMGKSISAQVLIEEALMKDICVIVFDPTAQWSGMLRKCDDKKMMSFYPKFGLKPQDARGFPGNIRAVKDARQIIDINKFIEPGHIQIFTLNKLQPKDMDIFVANIIREIFKNDPKEEPELKVLLVFDEVHRLLPKFGGSGEGFLQIERGCREFRKWGIGQVLISQVMNDFVGEIKANINTEVQTRTVEEHDLERIKSKYGEGFLKSLVKSEVGVAMFQNAEYNRGLPYFINFRPILHNTRRLSDEELDKYNQYNDQVDELGYQIEQLEELKIDTFDLKMELKLVKDKIMVGNFSVVDIYLEGLKPRIAKQWEKLGKTPKKLQIKLASEEEIKKAVEEAKKDRKAEEEKEAVESKAQEEAAKDPIEDLENKQLESLTFDNGAMIASIGELKDLLPSLDEDIFNTKVTAEKNEIADWAATSNEELGKKLKPLKTKDEMSKAIDEFEKSLKK